MDAMVSARVPRELRDQANDILAELGYSPTQLINAAYHYLLDAGALPDARKRGTSIDGQQNETDLTALREFLDATTLELPDELAAMTAADIRAARLKERHGTPA
jgi:antitoxin component of RelBE/YafQ-DinJ toxin-antitoxin module